MNQLIIAILFSLGIFFFIPQQSFASYTATDGTVQGNLDITPKDPPYAGLPLRLKFQFSNVPQGFSLRNCDCQLSVEEPGRLPSSIPLTLQNEAGPDVQFVTVSYLFPNNANYKLTMQAKPKQENAFTPFTLSWQVNVQENKNLVPYTSHADKNSFNYIGIVIPILIGIIFIAVIAFVFHRNLRSKK